MKYSVVTFGCRVNQADSLGFEEELLARGAEAGPVDTADVVVVNTCSVTASADQAARQTIRRIGRINPAARIVVTGCYATRRPDDIRALPRVEAVVSNREKARTVPLIFERWPLDRSVTTAERFADGEGSCGATIEPGVAGRTAFTLRVQTGCDEPCSYCIIPTTRGTPVSLPIPELLAEISRVNRAGFKEIALTGVHLGSYGRDLRPRSSLFELLTAIDEAWRGRRDRPLFRVSSLEPMDCTSDVVRLMAGSPVFARHFHLPLQHASNSVLARMRRPYTIERYAALVEDIRKRMPEASIGSDIIVGFPGESDEDVEHLTAYLRQSPLTHLHVFPYSDRPGTPAATLPGKVPGAVIRQRSAAVRDIGARLSADFRRSQLGTVHRALTLEDGSAVVTGNYLKLRIPPGRARNEWVEVKVLEGGRAELVEVAPIVLAVW